MMRRQAGLQYVLVATALLITSCMRLSDEPRRLLINGSRVSEPESPTVPAKLRGFNFWVALDQPLEPEDRIVTKILPGTNMARLVMVHWQDAKSAVECYASQPPYLKPECLAQFDAAVAWATGVGLWTVLTGRAKGGPDGHVFDNATLAAQMVHMWGTLAARYAKVHNIAGYEVTTKPSCKEISCLRTGH